MNNLIIKGLVVFFLIYGAFILKFGIGTGSIIMGAIFVGLAITTGLIGLIKKK